MEEVQTQKVEVQEVVSKPKPRMVEQDIAKGLAIILVMMLHILTTKTELFNIMGGIVGFIMSLFFFLTGYNYKSGKTFKENVTKRVKQILIPFLIYTFSITIISGIYYVITGEYTILEVLETYANFLLTRNLGSLFGLTYAARSVYTTILVGWFIQMMLVASILFYAVVDLCLNNVASFLSISIGCIVFTMALTHFEVKLPFYIVEAPTICVIFLFGALFKKYDLFNKSKLLWIIINSVIGYGLYLILAAMFQGAGLIMGGGLTSKYGAWEAPLTILMCIISSYAFINFCKLLAKIKPVSFILSWVGQNSLYYLLLHMVVRQYVVLIVGYKAPSKEELTHMIEPMSILVLALTIVGVTIFIILRKFIKDKIKEAKDKKKPQEIEGEAK